MIGLQVVKRISNLYLLWQLLPQEVYISTDPITIFYMQYTHILFQNVMTIMITFRKKIFYRDNTFISIVKYSNVMTIMSTYE